MGTVSSKVLVVEDEALIRFAIADDLRGAGFEVLEASDADAAIRLLGRHGDIRLVFTDIDIPGSMDGLRLSAVIRERWPPVAIVVTSGRGFPGPAALPAGSRFMPKPYATADVLDTFRALLA